MAPRVTVYEVGPRDGLQNEARTVPSADKLALVRALAGAGLRRIEATSFVSPRWIPQLADAAEVTAALPRAPGVSYVVLVPNAKGLERLGEALERAGPEHPPVDAAVFLSASETTPGRTSTAASPRRSTTRPRSCRRALPRAPASAATCRRRGAALTRGGSTRRAARRSPSGSSRSAVTRCRSGTRSASGRRTRRATSSGASSRAPGPKSSRSTCTTPEGRRSRTCSSGSRRGSPRSTRRSAAWAGAPTRPAPPGTWPPRISSTCCRAWTSRPASTGTGSSRRARSRSGSSRGASPARRSRRSSPADHRGARAGA